MYLITFSLLTIPVRNGGIWLFWILQLVFGVSSVSIRENCYSYGSMFLCL